MLRLRFNMIAIRIAQTLGRYVRLPPQRKSKKMSKQVSPKKWVSYVREIGCPKKNRVSYVLQTRCPPKNRVSKQVSAKK